MTLKIIGVVLGISIVGGWAYLHFNKQFGGAVTEELKKEYARSNQWDGEKFVNEIETSMDIGLKEMPSLLREYLKNNEQKSPRTNLPMPGFDKQNWQADTSTFKFIWFGHSVGLMQFKNLNVLIDPMFGDDTSPVGPLRTRRYTDSTLQIIDALPFIDAVFITHDHYDHLDYDSFKLLQPKVGHYYVPLGVKRHLLRWGIKANKISTFDWWESANLKDLSVTFVPARHFSGRGLSDRSTSLWGGWVFKNENTSVYWSGDGGYGPHFKIIGDSLGPFNYAFIECGQYNLRWHDIHMLPEESIQAAIDCKAQVSIPIHWGAFTLALHDWKEPVERFLAEAKKRNTSIVLPKLGVSYSFAQLIGQDKWWETY